MAIPNCKHVVEQLAAQYPDEWKAAHTGGARTEDFIRRLAYVLHSTVDAGFGLLGQYGDPNRIADDAIMYLGEGPGVDKGTGRPQSGFDVIGGAGGPSPTPEWNDISGPGAAIWVQPAPVGSGSGGGGAPPPTSPQPTAQDLLNAINSLAATVDAVRAKQAEMASYLVTRIAATLDDTKYEALNAANRASEIKTQIENLPTPGAAVDFPRYRGKFFGASVTLDPEPK